jgi:uncharacterized membrane protein YraQ (UPF0718 family)
MLDKLEEIKSLAIKRVAEHPFKTIDEIAEELEVSGIELKRIMTPQESNLFARPLRSGAQKWSDQEIIEVLKEARPYMVVGAFIVGAILTPPDVISQIMLAVPLWLLYEFGVFVAKFVIPNGDKANTN